MRTFIIRARKGTTLWERVRSQIGGRQHFEVVAHTVINAFFISNDFRGDVEVYIVLDSSEDFPYTIKLSSGDGLSIAGFHEEAVIDLVEKALKDSRGLRKDETRIVDPGVQVSGFGFDRLVSELLKTRPLYLLDRKGADIRETQLELNPVFVLSDHLAMPKKTVNALKRKGLNTLSLGNKMLFASQCVVILNYEMDYTKSGLYPPPAQRRHRAKTGAAECSDGGYCYSSCLLIFCRDTNCSIKWTSCFSIKTMHGK